jgi:putative YhbY family RNA-binding protein
MTELALTRDERLRLRAAAHHLNAVVLLGAGGLTDAVVNEIDRALGAHGLIKVRVPGDDRAARESMFAEIAQRLGAARIGLLGKVLILYRPLPAAETPAAAPRPVSAAARTGMPAPRGPTSSQPGRPGMRGGVRVAAPRRGAARSR